MAWLAYLLAIVLFNINFIGASIIVFMVGMVFHWKFWTVGIISFVVGLCWGKVKITP